MTSIGPLELVAAVAVAVLLVTLASPHRPGVDRWAEARGLRLTEVNRPLVRHYVRTARILRGVGMVAGAVLPTLALRAYGGVRAGVGVGLGVVWAYVGYLVAALYAELTLVRPAPVRRRASLAPRRLADYLPGRQLWAQRAAAAVVVAGAVAASVLDPAPVRWMNGYGGGRTPAVLGAAAVAVALAVEALERWVVRRAQPLGAPDLVAADDAIRSQSVHTLCGSGVALLVLLASAQAAALGQRDLGDLRRPMVAAGAAGVLASYAACMRFTHGSWRVRRPAAGLS